MQAHNLLVFIADHFRSELQASWLLYILVPQHFLTLLTESHEWKIPGCKTLLYV